MGQYEALCELRAAMQERPDSGYVHLYPTWDPIRHVCGPPGTKCWCNPTLDHVDERIVIHNPSH